MTQETGCTVQLSRWSGTAGRWLTASAGMASVMGRKSFWILAAGLLLPGLLLALAFLPSPPLPVPADRLVAAFRQHTWIEGCIPAPRGCILDRRGLPLAWTTRHFDVNWAVPAAGAPVREEFAILSRYLGSGLLITDVDVASRGGQTVVVKRDLSPKEVAAVAILQSEITGLTITSRTVRHQVTDKLLQSRLGEVQVVNGREVGVSGEEKRYDATLTGRDGRFRVMVDKEGRWLKESWQKTLDVQPGYDVYLPAATESAVLASTAR